MTCRFRAAQVKPILQKLLYTTGSSAIVTFNGNIAITTVPEPGSVALLVGIMTVGAGVLRRRRK